MDPESMDFGDGKRTATIPRQSSKLTIRFDRVLLGSDSHGINLESFLFTVCAFVPIDLLFLAPFSQFRSILGRC